MFAQHPITGKPVRLITNEVHLYKNRKTLVWLRNEPSHYEEPHKFNRWYTLVTDYKLAEKWSSVLGAYPSATIITEPSNGAHHWMRTKAPKTRELLFLSKAVMSAYGLEEIQKEGFKNIICLEELVHMFPHVTRTYVPGDSESLTALMVASVFRVQRALGFTENELASTSLNVYISELKENYEIFVGPVQKPEPLWLIQQYFESDKSARTSEIKKCLEENLNSTMIDKIILLNEEDYTGRIPSSDKIIQQIIGHRLSYADVVMFIKEKVPDDTIVVFSNSDIYLTDTWKDIWSVDMNNVFLSLLRYDAVDGEEEPKIFGPRADSQDTWAVFSNSVKSREWDYNLLNFEFGKSGCDNAINVEFLRKKFLVANPALTLKTVHCHTSQVRTYVASDIIDKPVFLYIQPTGLHDLAPATELRTFEKSWPSPTVFPRRVYSADEKQLSTYCTMASRDEKIMVESDADNTFIPARDEFLYSLKDAFVTPNGLSYGYDRLYLGKSKAMREAWANTNISHITPCIGVKDILSVYLDNETSSNMWLYISKYLSKILRLRSAGYKGDMWLPRGVPRLQEFLQFFKWDENILPVLPLDDDIVGYGKNVTLLSPRSQDLVYKEDMDALRSEFKMYIPEIKYPKRVVIFQDDVTLTPDDVTSLENVLENYGYEVNIIYPNRSSTSFITQRVCGVGTCIATPGSEHLFWLLPKTARIIDIIPETNITSNSLHMAGACMLEYWVTLIQRAKGSARSEIVVNKVMDTIVAIEKNLESPKPHMTLNKSKITIPVGFSGFHGHTGDSFREMCSIWAEKGWVDYEFTKDSPYVWWGGVGETLLYDRANYEWLKTTPATYKKLLVGNPDASKMENATQWSFWPRHPKLVEARVKEGLPTWEERDKTMVFYGKVENDIQKNHRENNLYEACDEFDMPMGADKQYKYKPKEYLNALAHSKFGLCLAGYGPKCNREIECMAMGTVPVVAPDVDMEKYYSPPNEGVHFIRLKSFDPAEAKEIISSIDETKWKEMSTKAQSWWRENASAEGLFKITKMLSI